MLMAAMVESGTVCEEISEESEIWEESYADVSPIALSTDMCNFLQA